MDCSRKSGPAFELGLAPLRGANRWLKETSPGSRDRRTTTDAIDRALMMLCRAGHSGADARTDGLGHVGAPVTAEGRGGAISASDNGKAGVMIDACLCGQGGCVGSSKRKLRQFRVSPRSAHFNTALSRPCRSRWSGWAVARADITRAGQRMAECPDFNGSDGLDDGNPPGSRGSNLRGWASGSCRLLRSRAGTTWCRSSRIWKTGTYRFGW